MKLYGPLFLITAILNVRPRPTHLFYSSARFDIFRSSPNFALSYMTLLPRLSLRLFARLSSWVLSPRAFLKFLGREVFDPSFSPSYFISGLTAGLYPLIICIYSRMFHGSLGHFTMWFSPFLASLGGTCLSFFPLPSMVAYS